MALAKFSSLGSDTQGMNYTQEREDGGFFVHSSVALLDFVW